jgi:hypothetical protein
MKRILVFTILPILSIFLFVAAQSISVQKSPVPEEIELGAPDEVMTILERSCFDCHTKDGSAKAKLSLNFSKWDNYKLTKKIGKLSDIAEEVKEQKMPPKRYIDDYPDKALSGEEIEIIANWANEAADKLMEE